MVSKISVWWSTRVNNPGRDKTAPLLLLLRHFKSSIFILNLNRIHSTFCKTYFGNISGEITNFSGEMW